jgi:hypothetical protein
MNEDNIIEAALQRRFSRAVVPECPDGPWRPAARVRAYKRSRGFAYACAALVVFVSAGLAGQAAGVLPGGVARFFQGSVKPLPPLVHRADRLTIAQAQQHMPFTIVVPAGLPPNTMFQYAHVVSEHPVPRVALLYQTQIDGRYYRININETTAASGPPVAHFEALSKGNDGRLHDHRWTLPLRRWKHGNIFMETLPQGIPPSMVDRIVRENTL